MSDKQKGGRPSRKEYRRVRNEDKGDEKPATKENEVRVVASRGQRLYIKYAIDILTGGEGKKQHDSVILSGMGNAVYNVVNVAEILKRRVKGLHQTTEISSQTLTDKYEAVEKDKEGLEVERKVSVIEIVLSTKPLDVNHYGYQKPLPESEVTEQDERVAEKRERRPRGEGEGRGSGRGGRGGRGGDRAPRDDRAPARGGRGGRGGERGGRGGDRDRAPRDDRAPRGGRGGRGGDRDDRAPRGGRGGRGGDRDDRAPRGGRGGDRAPRDDRAPSRGGRGGDRAPRDDRAPRGGRGGRGGDRDDRAPPRGGRGGYSEGRREGGRGGRTDRGGRR